MGVEGSGVGDWNNGSLASAGGGVPTGIGGDKGGGSGLEGWPRTIGSPAVPERPRITGRDVGGGTPRRGPVTSKVLGSLESGIVIR